MSSDSDAFHPQSRLHHPDDLNLTEFFEDKDGGKTIVKNSDLEAIIPDSEKSYLVEQDRYWVNNPYCFVVIYKSKKENEYQYYVVEPHLTQEEKQLVAFLKDKIRVSLDYNEVRTRATKEQRALKLREKTFDLLKNYNLINDQTINRTSDTTTLPDIVNAGLDKLYQITNTQKPTENTTNISPSDEKQVSLTREQTEKIIYYIIRDFIKFERVDGLMQDSKIEDISINGWNSSVFIVHSEYDQMITNITFGEEDLDEFISALAQKAKKGISKRQPNVDATLEDGSRAILMLSDEITDKGSNFTIRKFNNIPFTPIDLINWGTFNIEQMVYLWLAVENNKSGIIAGGTASGKTTTLNAISLFIPANKKAVSIEDTRELQMPHKNWSPLVTRDSFSSDTDNEIDEIDLLWNSLRMRPNYVIYGEVRGEEARSLFQNLNTGHTTYSTFHADNPNQVRSRLTTDPINVNETLFGGLDFIINQKSVSVTGQNVRRALSITELGEYEPQNDKFDIQKPFVWNSEKDIMEGSLNPDAISSNSTIMAEIREGNGWTRPRLTKEINRRKVVLSYLLENEMTTYREVAATIQGYMYSGEMVLSQIADDTLAEATTEFQDMKNVEINASQELEENTPRPPTDDNMKAKARSILDEYSEVYNEIDINLEEINQQTANIKEVEGDAPEENTISEDLIAGVSDDIAQDQAPQEDKEDNYGYENDEIP